MTKINNLLQFLSPSIHELNQHSLYHSIQTEEDVHTFMESHIFAVWDFMSLLKALQQKLTDVQTPWLPTFNPSIRRFINEIVLGEESDEVAPGVYMSHYELYVQAMQEAGASTQKISSFVKAIEATRDYDVAKQKIALPEEVKEFVDFTFEVIATGQAHIIAAVFTFGREDVIPDMFTKLVEDFNRKFPGKYRMFKLYLDRHIELDGDEHGPLSLKMIEELCGDDEQKWEDVAVYATRAIEKRVSLWTKVEASIKHKVYSI